MKKIAIFIPNLEGGGAERVFVSLTKAFVAGGYKVEFLLLQNEGELLNDLSEKVHVVSFEKKNIRSSLFPLFRYLLKSKPDVLIAVMWPLTIIAIVAFWMSGIKKNGSRLFFSDHNIFSLSARGKHPFKILLQRLSIRMFYPRADQCLCVSSGVAKDICEFGNIKDNNFSVIYNPIILSEEIDPVFFGLADFDYRIINVGNLKPVKDHFTLLKAFKQVREQVNAELMILGEGDCKESIEALIRDLDLTNSVKLLGFKKQTKQWYASSNLFVLSSQHEGFGNVIVEALMCGVPVVSTDCPSGPAEILENGKYGKLVPVGDVDALAEAMLESLQEEHDVEALKARAADFSVDKIANQYLDVMFPERLSKGE